MPPLQQIFSQRQSLDTASIFHLFTNSIIFQASWTRTYKKKKGAGKTHCLSIFLALIRISLACRIRRDTRCVKYWVETSVQHEGTTYMQRQRPSPRAAHTLTDVFESVDRSLRSPHIDGDVQNASPCRCQFRRKGAHERPFRGFVHLHDGLLNLRMDIRQSIQSRGARIRNSPQ